ncbi:hypothetical protein OKW42_002861 [Paraburkholderia sp. WC7.3d]|uniref:TniQ domain-containing protein n=1 Tax=Paraburkholderia podalyriae TaxID=1938811 RepID=A0ABR7PVQ4_9BURK|nr:hypothetical protein [Paraburkholderia podalyriae]
MIRLPFIPPRLPDELFGSWQARIRLHNGDRAWKELLSAVRYRSTPSDDIDMFDYSPELEARLNVLGCTFERTLLELTTLPYWLAFDAAPRSAGYISGSTTIPQLCIESNRYIRNLKRLGEAHNSRRGSLWYCPDCLTLDLHTFGEPYWHRLHQLPTIYYCPDHLKALRDRCPHCGAAFTRDRRSLLPLPRIVCECGAHLSGDARLVAPSTFLKRIASVSGDALNSECPDWDRNQMHAFLRFRLDGKSPLALIVEAIEHDLGIDDYHESLERVFHLPPKITSLERLRTPTCCLLLAALDIDFRAAAHGARKQRPCECYGPTYHRGATESEEACQLLEKLAKDAPRKNLAADFGIHYWRVRIWAPEWFSQHFPGTQAHPLPSIQADRGSIRGRIQSLSDARSIPHTVRLIRHSSAGLRARVRDTAWLKEIIRDFRQTANSRDIERPPHTSRPSFGDPDNLFPHHPRSLSQNRAKAMLRQQKSKMPSSGPSFSERRAYWTVRLLAPDWLKRQFPTIRETLIPTLEQDRSMLWTRVLGAKKTLPPNRRAVRAVRRWSSFLRASIRDQEWLRSLLREYEIRFASLVQQRSTIDRLETLAASQSKKRGDPATAMIMALRTHGRGKKPTIDQIARGAGISYWSARYLIKKNGAVATVATQLRHKSTGMARTARIKRCPGL